LEGIIHEGFIVYWVSAKSLMHRYVHHLHTPLGFHTNLKIIKRIGSAQNKEKPVKDKKKLET